MLVIFLFSPFHVFLDYCQICIKNYIIIAYLLVTFLLFISPLFGILLPDNGESNVSSLTDVLGDLCSWLPLSGEGMYVMASMTFTCSFSTDKSVFACSFFTIKCLNDTNAYRSFEIVGGFFAVLQIKARVLCKPL